MALSEEGGAFRQLLIEELTGDRRKMVFRGTEAPKGGPRRGAAFALGGDVRAVETYNPGVVEPDVNILGTRERDLTIDVQFRDGLTTDGRALDRKKLLDDIRLKARLLRITWGNDVRRGVLFDLELGIEGARDITARLTFHIYGRGMTPASRQRSAPLALPTSIGDIDDGITTTHASLKVPGITFDIASQIDTLFASVANPLASLIGAASDIEAGIGDTRASLKQGVNNLATLHSRLETVSGHLMAIVGEVGDGDALALAAFERARVEAILLLQALADQCLELGATMETKAASVVQQRSYITRQFDTLESIGQRFGRSVPELLRMNPTLTGGPLTAGQTIAV